MSLSAAIFFAAFTVLHVSIDLLGWWRATPLRQVGMNSLLIYIGNVMLGVSKIRESLLLLEMADLNHLACMHDGRTTSHSR